MSTTTPTTTPPTAPPPADDARRAAVIVAAVRAWHRHEAARQRTYVLTADGLRALRGQE